MLNNLEKIIKTHGMPPQIAPPFGMLTPPTGTRREQGLELIRRCKKRDAKLEKTALEAEREGDSDGCWLAMAARAENKRVMDKIERELPAA